jgi:hypothetical protein
LVAACALGALASLFLVARPAEAQTTCEAVAIDDDFTKLEVRIGVDDRVALADLNGVYAYSRNDEAFVPCSRYSTGFTEWIDILGSDAGQETITLVHPGGALSTEAVTIDLGNGNDHVVFEFGGLLAPAVADPGTGDALTIGSAASGAQVARVPGAAGGFRIDDGEILEVHGGGGNDSIDAATVGGVAYSTTTSTDAEDIPATTARATTGVVFAGGDGDDSLVSGDGSDAFSGELGIDRIDYAASPAAVTVDLGGGSATGQGDDALDGVEDVRGSNLDDVLIGDELGNDLLGGDGGDALAGGVGDDVVSGEGGDDTVSEGAAANGADLLSGGDGEDTLDYGERATAPVLLPDDDLANDGEDANADGDAADAGDERDEVLGFEDYLVVEPVLDLAVAEVTARSNEDRGVLRLQVLIENRGEARSLPTTVEASAAGWETRAEDVGEIAPGDETTVTIRLSIPDDQYDRDLEVHVVVDPDGGSGDADLANNTLDEPVTIGPAPTTGPTGGDEDGGDSVLPLVVAAAALAAAVAGAAWAVRRGRVRPRTPPERAEAAEQPIQIPPPAVRVVSAGFAEPSNPDRPVDSDVALAPGRDYVFWLRIGELLRESATGLPRDRAAGAGDETILTVVLFAFEGDLELTPGATVGRFRLTSDDRVVALDQPLDGRGDGLAPPPGSEGVMRFPVRTPPISGRFGMRANVYVDRVLLQSRRVTVSVADGSARVDGAISAEMDYSASLALDHAGASQHRPHRASLMFNRNDDGAAGLMVYASDGREIACPARIPEGFGVEHIDRARQALRDVAYEPAVGDAEPAYRYASPRSLDELRRDLVTLATAGSRIYFAIRHQLACPAVDGEDPVATFETLMLRTGFVEVVNRDPPSFVLPAALLYDRPLDDAVPESTIALCGEFVEAFEAHTDLVGFRCLAEGCPHTGEDTVVCPSGFWGYRHDLGFPVTQERSPDGTRATERAPTIGYEHQAHVDALVATDLEAWEEHLSRLKAVMPGLGLPPAAGRQAAFDLLGGTPPHVAYFYCHGGSKLDPIEGRADPVATPYLRVGGPKEAVITSTNIRTKGFPWRTTRPLVFINGCHTTALEPRRALEFVSAFVVDAFASGVVGTEITIYEPLAIAFSEEFFRRFAGLGQPVGSAVRGARLALLGAGNPLGLAYVPFVPPDLRLARMGA